jgi:hypothetical protein
MDLMGRNIRLWDCLRGSRGGNLIHTNRLNRFTSDFYKVVDKDGHSTEDSVGITQV